MKFSNEKKANNKKKLIQEVIRLPKNNDAKPGRIRVVLIHAWCSFVCASVCIIIMFRSTMMFSDVLHLTHELR